MDDRPARPGDGDHEEAPTPIDEPMGAPDPTAWRPGPPPEPPPPAGYRPPDPALEPPSPAEAPPAPPPGAIVGWAAPTEGPKEWPPSRLGVGSVVGLSLDTYGRHWPVLIALALPVAFMGGLAALDPRSIALTIAAGLLAGLFTIVATAAISAATDDDLAGRPLDTASLFGRGLRRTPALLAVALLFVAIAIVIVLAIALPIAIAAQNPGESRSAAAILGLVVGLVAGVLLVYVAARLWLYTPSVAVAGRGPVDSIRESWRLTRGHVLRLLGIFIVIGLIASLVSGGASLISSLAPNRLVAMVATALGTAIGTPLLAIPGAIAYGILTGRWQGMPPPAREGNPRRSALVLLLGVGGLMFVVGSAFTAQSIGRFVPSPDAGKVVVGTAQNAADPCSPLNQATEFSAAQTLYLAAYFSTPLEPSQSASVTFYVDGEAAPAGDIEAGPQRVGCYYEDEFLQLGPGQYRMVIQRGDTVLAQGEWVVR